MLVSSKTSYDAYLTASTPSNMLIAKRKNSLSSKSSYNLVPFFWMIVNTFFKLDSNISSFVLGDEFPLTILARLESLIFKFNSLDAYSVSFSIVS